MSRHPQSPIRSWCSREAGPPQGLGFSSTSHSCDLSPRVPVTVLEEGSSDSPVLAGGVLWCKPWHVCPWQSQRYPPDCFCSIIWVVPLAACAHACFLSLPAILWFVHYPLALKLSRVSICALYLQPRWRPWFPMSRAVILTCAFGLPRGHLLIPQKGCF